MKIKDSISYLAVMQESATSGEDVEAIEVAVNAVRIYLRDSLRPLIVPCPKCQSHLWLDSDFDTICTACNCVIKEATPCQS